MMILHLNFKHACHGQRPMFSDFLFSFMKWGVQQMTAVLGGIPLFNAMPS